MSPLVSCPDSQLASQALGIISARLQTEEGNLTFDVDGAKDRLTLPRPAAELLCMVLAHLANGDPVSVVPAHKEMTTQEAANYLNVSRPTLIKLLETEEIPHRKVGTHRRIRFSDLHAFKKADDAKRRAAADELANLTEELGLY